jgi:hypothetical protein
MNSGPTVPLSWDYLVELSDDGKQADQPESELIIMPPARQAEQPTPTPEPGS